VMTGKLSAELPDQPELDPGLGQHL
jgi:hypothetical protein